MIRVFDYEMNEVASIKIYIKMEIYKRMAICKKKLFRVSRV